MRLRTRSIATLVFGLWVLAWFALYLEIVRYHHVALTRLDDILWPAAGGAQPGAFVRAVVVSSVFAPVCAALLWIRTALSHGHLQIALIPLLLGVGAPMVLLGAVNQLVRRPPWAFDPTLRTGNGGFIVIGLALVAAALQAAEQQRQSNAAARNR
jgi:hypothetical protein